MSQEKARANVAMLETYLSQVDALPAKDGKVFVEGVAVAAGIDRQVLYRNPRARALLEAAIAHKGLVGIEERQQSGSSDAERALERRIRSLEARNAALAAENADLRSRLRQVEHIEEVLTSGRRVIP